MPQMWLGINFFGRSQVSSTKNWMKQINKQTNKFGELSTEETQEITGNAIPVTTKKH